MTFTLLQCCESIPDPGCIIVALLEKKKLCNKRRPIFLASARYLGARVNSKGGYESANATSRSPLSPTEVKELATVRLLSACALLCSL